MKARSLTQNALWNITSIICNILLLFLGTPIIIRGLGTENYGIYVILGSIAGMLAITNLGLGEATLRYVAEYHAKNDPVSVNRVFSSTLLLYAILGGAITAAIFIFPGPLIHLLNLTDSPAAFTLIRLTVLMFWLNLLGSCLLAIPKALQRYDWCAAFEFCQNLFRLGVVIGIIRSGYGLVALMWGSLVIAFFALLVLIAVARRLVPYLAICWPGMNGFKQVLRYGVFIFLGQMVGLLWQYGDSILLSSFIGPAAVAFFSVPMQLVGKCFQVITAGISVMFPRFAAKGGDFQSQRKEIGELYLIGTQIGLLGSIFICVPLAVMLPDFLRLWISPEFSENTYEISTVLAGSYIIRGAFLAYDALLKGLGYPRIIFLITLFSSLMIVGIDVALIPIWGLNGAGFAYIVSPVVGIITIIWIFKRILQLDMLYFFTEIIIPYLIGLIILFAGVWIRSQAWWPQMGWIGFLTISSIFGIGTIVGVLGVGKALGCLRFLANHKNLTDYIIKRIRCS